MPHPVAPTSQRQPRVSNNDYVFNEILRLNGAERARLEVAGVLR